MQAELTAALTTWLPTFPAKTAIRAGGWKCLCKATVFCWHDQLNSVIPFARHIARCSKALEVISADDTEKVRALVALHAKKKSRVKAVPKAAPKVAPKRATGAAAAPAGPTRTLADPVATLEVAASGVALNTAPSLRDGPTGQVTQVQLTSGEASILQFQAERAKVRVLERKAQS